MSKIFRQPTLRRALVSAVSAVFVPAAALTAAVSLPAAAQYAPSYAPAAAAAAQNLQISSDRGLKPGAVLRFQVQAAPNGVANLVLQARRTINVLLTEVATGVYTGEYRVQGVDRIRANDRVRVDVRHGGRVLATSFSVPYQLDVYAPQPVPVVMNRVDGFTVTPGAPWGPGTEVLFALQAQPRSNVSVTVPGWSRSIALLEVAPGRYEGSYTMRRQDPLPNPGDIVATVRQGTRTIATGTFRPGEYRPVPGVDNRAPEVRALSPREGERVMAGSFDVVVELHDGRMGSGLDRRSVRMLVGGADVTPQTRIEGDRVIYRNAFAPGRYTVDVSARDMAGNAVRRNWSFDVVSAGGTVMTPTPLQPVPPVVVPPHAVRVMSHGANALIAGPTVVTGQTTPFATVNVQVTGQMPVAGGVVAVERSVFSQAIQADARGQFSFTFTPTVPMPGNRYNVRMTSNANGQVAESQLTLVHQ